MTIFLEPSECRDNTRLPQSVIEAGQLLPNLEQYTGADLLISTLRMPPLKLCDDSQLSQMNLRKHIESGILVARKTGRDLTSSIPDEHQPSLKQALERMQKWTKNPWLLFVGVKHEKNGNCYIDNQDTGFTWKQVEMARIMWEHRGGTWHEVASDRYIPDFINNQLTALREIKAHPVRRVYKPIKQHLVAVPDWHHILRLLLGNAYSSEKVDLIATATGSLWGAIEWLSNPYFKMNGVGPKVHEEARRLLGYETDSVSLRLSELLEDENEAKEKVA